MSKQSVVAHGSPQPISEQLRFDISNEAWREYVYPGVQNVLRVVGAKTLILDKRIDGDRHRLIVEEDGRQVGMYVTPGWLAIRWQTPDGQHGITF